ncbi:hypothetical protein C8J57DRAFT_1465657 [Mycena rebaudengoi]|nr:hypothetical protein C8J57DRAFT_1465657 [Mycena rebaudengoi]
MEFDPIKDVLASNLAAIQEALILGIRAPVRDSVHGLIDYQYFAQVQEREKYWGGTARENEKGNSQQGREHFDAMQNTWPQWWLLLRRSTAPDLADYASPRHAQRFRNYCGTVGLVFILLRELATWTTRPQECGRVWTKCEVLPRRMGQGCVDDPTCMSGPRALFVADRRGAEDHPHPSGIRARIAHIAPPQPRNDTSAPYPRVPAHPTRRTHSPLKCLEGIAHSAPSSARARASGRTPLAAPSSNRTTNASTGTPPSGATPRPRTSPTTALWVVKPATTMLSCSTRRTRVVGRAHLHAHVNARPQAHSHDKPMPTPEPARTNRHARARETGELRDKDAVDVSSSPHRRPRIVESASRIIMPAPAISARSIRKTRGHASAAAGGVKDARGARRTAKARATRG